jgi:chromosome segregation ATPase
MKINIMDINIVKTFRKKKLNIKEIASTLSEVVERQKKLEIVFETLRKAVSTMGEKVSEFERDDEAFATLRRDIDELKGNYEHNTVPTLENCRDFVISTTVEVDGLKKRVEGIDSYLKQDADSVIALAAQINALEAQVKDLQSLVSPEASVYHAHNEPGNDVPYTAKSERIIMPESEKGLLDDFVNEVGKLIEMYKEGLKRLRGEK